MEILARLTLAGLLLLPAVDVPKRLENVYWLLCWLNRKLEGFLDGAYWLLLESLIKI
jgi:hypothetical protein